MIQKINVQNCNTVPKKRSIFTIYYCLHVFIVLFKKFYLKYRIEYKKRQQTIDLLFKRYIKQINEQKQQQKMIESISCL